MIISTHKRGLNKDECYCGSEKDIKNMLLTVPLDDSYECVINMGEYISRDKNREEFIFKFRYSSRFYEDVSDHEYRRRLWFSFNPIKKKDITEELKEEFKEKAIPLVKSEILSCIKRNDIINFVSSIKVSIKNNKLVITREDR